MPTYRLERIGLGYGATGSCACSAVQGGRIHFVRGFAELHLDDSAAQAFEAWLRDNPRQDEFRLVDHVPPPVIVSVSKIDTTAIAEGRDRAEAALEAEPEWLTWTQAQKLGFQARRLKELVEDRRVSTQLVEGRVRYCRADLLRAKEKPE